MMEEMDDCYTVEEVAKKLRVSRSHLFALWERGEGPPRLQLGRRVVVPVSKFREWLYG
jgi:excisionase family DNA binding protein